MFIPAKTAAVMIQPVLRLMLKISMKLPPRRKRMVGIAMVCIAMGIAMVGIAKYKTRQLEKIDRLPKMIRRMPFALAQLGSTLVKELPHILAKMVFFFDFGSKLLVLFF